MKRCFALLLALFILLPATAYGADMSNFTISDWARSDVEKALDLGIILHYGDDFRRPILRGDFAEKATSLVAIEFGSKLDSYLRILMYRGWAEENHDFSISPLDALGMAQKLGIIQGRGNGELDEFSTITRQEAAVILARTYRAYHATTPTDLKPLSYFDQEEIAPWALNDVQLLYHLGIMTGNEWNCFQPQSSYTIEQCLVTLLRLHEKAPNDGSKTENPFTLPVWDKALGKNWPNDMMPIAMETDQYYIYSFSHMSGLGPLTYHIDIFDQDLTRRTYSPIILASSNNFRGPGEARPENVYLSADGTKLYYTATLTEDTYHYDVHEKEEPVLLFSKGVYTVTMNLQTGAQTYTRADLPPA